MPLSFIVFEGAELLYHSYVRVGTYAQRIVKAELHFFQLCFFVLELNLASENIIPVKLFSLHIGYIYEGFWPRSKSLTA